MRRNCDYCGNPYDAQTARSRFCGSPCRIRAHRAGGVPEHRPAERRVTQRDDSLPSNVEVTREVLEAADRLRTPAGVGALTLATKLDMGTDTGSALAALQKQHMAALEEALRDAKVAASPLDELRARREARLAG
jgi:hypothetical protein